MTDRGPRRSLGGAVKRVSASLITVLALVVGFSASGCGSSGGASTQAEVQVSAAHAKTADIRDRPHTNPVAAVRQAYPHVLGAYHADGTELVHCPPMPLAGEVRAIGINCSAIPRDLYDAAFMVRRAAACALAAIADPESGPTILQHYQSRREEINVRMGLESALDALKIPYERHPV